VRVLVGLSGALLVSLVDPASAQEASAPTAPASPSPASPSSKAVDGVVVTAPTQAGVRSGIDRRSYSLSGDLQASTGSIGDALRNVPSVEVDPQGVISLRGDTNVTILVDGKPSGRFKGAGRAELLQQLPASQFARVEVMTNPSAAFDANGSAGVINLISKKAPGQGVTGSVQASLGDAGIVRTGGSVGYNSGKRSLTADFNARRNTYKTKTTDRRTLVDAATQRPFDSLSQSQGRTIAHFGNLHVQGDYDVNAQTRLSAEVQHLQMDFAARDEDSFDVGSPRGEADALSQRSGRHTYWVYVDEAELTAYRKFSGEDHDLTVDLDHNATINKSRRPSTYLTGAPAAGPFETFTFDQHQAMTKVSADYHRPLPNQAKLSTGFQVEDDDYHYANGGARGASAATATPDISLTNRFRYGQVVSALYATLERPFKKLTALAGLRIENARIRTEQLTLGGVRRDSDTRLFPSLHLSYELDEHRQLKGSYARRIERPDPDDLNPFPDRAGLLSVTAGNPALKPEETQSYEAAYEYRDGPVYQLATVFFRDSRNTVTDVSKDLGGGAVLSTKENQGRQRQAGLELAAGGRLAPKLTYTLSTTVAYSEIDAANLGLGSERSAVAVGAKGNLNCQITAKDLFQVNTQLSAKRLTPQGYRPAFGVLNLGYQRKIDDRLVLVATVRDVLNSTGTTEVIDRPGLSERIYRDHSARRFMVGLTYALGGKVKKPSFDYGAGAPL
jgi:outer membrane receptor protein involved in Fe transport